MNKSISANAQKNNKMNAKKKQGKAQKQSSNMNDAAEVMRLKKEVASLRSNPKNSSFNLSECAKKFLIAQANPFNVAAMGACVPHEPAPNSQKATLKTSFTMTIGGANNAASVGAIYFTPCLNYNTPCVYYTNTSLVNLSPTSDFTGAEVAPFCSAAYFNSPYSVSDLTLTDYNTPAASGRIVSYGVRISSETATNFNGGVLYFFADPSHSNVMRAPKTTILSQAQCARMPIGEKLKTQPLIFSLGPQFVDEQQYPSLGGINYGNDCIIGNYPLSRTQSAISYTTGDRYGNGQNYNAVSGVDTSTKTVTLSTALSRSMASGETIQILDSSKKLIGYTYLTAAANAAGTTVVVNDTTNISSGCFLGSGMPSKLSEAYSSNGTMFVPGGAPAVVYIDPSNASTECTFLIELIAHVEYVGTKTSALQTPSHGDSYALSKIMSSLSQVPALVAASPYTPWLKLAAQAAIRGFESYTGIGVVSAGMAAQAIQKALRL